MTSADHDRLEQARLRRARKLTAFFARYPDREEAKQRAFDLHASGTPLKSPEPYDPEPNP